jgi:hypothetical protein
MVTSRKAIPFKFDGTMRTEASFSEIDAQYGGEAPWISREVDVPTPR